ncbi:hypothetical protein IAI18_02745 [Acetobacteraceae bacterium H6797]|nr:hypothetical protein [Acetobacteraceae bacterium H6797]
MKTSRPIEAQGRFVGVAVDDARPWRFIALDPAVSRLDGQRFETLTELRHAAHVASLATSPSGGQPRPRAKAA